MKLERLALICHHTCPLAAPGNGKTGGMNVYVREMSKHLGEMGLKVDVFTRNHGDDHDDVMDVGNNVRLVHLKGGPPGATPDKVYAHLPAFQRELGALLPGGGADLPGNTFSLLAVWASRRKTGPDLEATSYREFPYPCQDQDAGQGQ